MRSRQAGFLQYITAALLFTILVLTTSSHAVTSALATTPPAHLAVVATLGGSSTAVAANAALAAVDDGAGVVIYDIRGATPVGAYRLMLPGTVQSIVLTNTLLVIGVDATVLLYRLDGTTPLPLSRFTATAAINHLAIDADRLYLATRTGLAIVDIADPTRPTHLGLLQRPLGVQRVIADAATVYALATYEAIPWAGLSSVIKVDVSNPQAPRLLHETALSGQFHSGVAIARHGDTIFVAGDIGGPHGVGQMSFEIWHFDATTLAGGAYQGFSATLTGERATDLVAYGDYLLALSTTGGLSVIDPDDPANLQRIAQLNLGFFRTALAIVGERAFAALDSGGVQMIDLSAPTAPTAGAPQPLLGPTFDVAAFGDALLTVSSAGDTPGRRLSSFDLRALNAPRLGDQVTIAGGAQIDFDPSTAGIHLLYDGNTDLTRFVDAREPGELRLSGELRLGPTNSIAVQGTRAYVGITGPSAATPALAVFDISDFTEPREIGRLELPSVATELAIVGERLYLLDGLQDLVIYSLTDPANPSKLGAITINERSIRMAVSGETVYVGLTEGVQIVDARNPTAPVLGAQFATAIGYPQLAVSEGRLALTSEFNAAEPGTLQVYTLTDQLTPAFLAETALPPTLEGFNRLTGANGRFALARSNRGVGVYTILNNTTWLPLIGG